MCYERNDFMLRFGLTCFLILLNGAWISVWFYIKLHPQNIPVNPELKIQLETLHIQEIEFNFSDPKNRIQLVKEDHFWKLTNPVEWEANLLAVDQFLRELALLKPLFVFDVKEKKDLENYGLAMPFCTIKCNTQDHTYLLQVSTTHASNGKVYIFENETNKIFVLKPQFVECFCRQVEEWCNPFFCTLENIKTLSFDTPQINLYLQKQADEWFIKTPVEAKANSNHVETICTQLQTLELKNFLSSAEMEKWIPKFASDTQLYRLKVSDKQQSIFFKLMPDKDVADGKTYIAQRNEKGPLFVFRSNVIERLLNAQETLRERNLFDFKPDAIKKIIYQRDTLGITLQAISEYKWEVIETVNENFVQAQKASSKTVEQFVGFINNLYVERFLTAAELPPLETYTSFKLTLTTDVTCQCQFYYKDHTYYLHLGDEPEWFQLTLIASDLAELTAEKFQEKTLWKWESDERLIGVEWIKEKGKKVSVDSRLDARSLQALRVLRAQKWLKTPVDFHIVPREPQRIIFTTQNALGERHSYELQFWERINGNFQSGCYENQTFVLSQDWIDVLFQLIHKPHWDQMARIWNAEDI